LEGRGLKPLLAELFGTFVLVFVVAGARTLHNDAMVTAVAYGAALVAVLHMIGGVSGAHVNPAVTFGLAVAGRIRWSRAAQYGTAQVAGAVLAALALDLALADRAGRLGATLLAEDVTTMQGVLVEAILTAFLVFAVTAGRSGSGLAIGLVLTMDTLVGFGLTGASMNPARTLGPGIVSGELTDAWVYLVGPLAGGAAGALLARYLHEA
jgi:MIP family channel proteins